METPKLHGRIITGLMLIVIGALFALDNFNIVSIPSEYINIGSFFILLGAFFLLLSRNRTAGLIMIAVGIFLSGSEYWPLLLVLLGIFFIFGKKGSKFKNHGMNPKSINISNTDQESDYLESVNIFGGGSTTVHSNNFKGGSVVSIFGGADINLSNCTMADGENPIEITSIFGGSTFIVPSNWKVQIDVVPLFGGFGDERIKNPNSIPIEGKTLIIKGVVIFGGGEIKSAF